MKNIIAFVIFLAVSLSAQVVTYRSKIVDSETKESLYKASIVVLGSTTGTLSDETGQFAIELNLKEDPVLRISYVGYETAFITVKDFEKYLSAPILLTRKLVPSQTIIITSGMPDEKNRYSAFDKISEKQLQQNYNVQDIPQYLSTLPSTTWYSENGNGIGYNYLSIRGFDQRRLAVMVNGIPQNDPEDHNVYWLDFNDILGNTDLIQVQRGAGNAVFGYPSIGGAINIVTSTASLQPKFVFATDVGGYGTSKFSSSYSSGLIGGKYAFTAKLSKTYSEGYRENSWSDFSSYYISLLRYDADFSTQFNMYGGPLTDGLAYTGLPKSYIKNKALRKLNYSDWGGRGDAFYTVNRRNEEMERFTQPHFELLNEYKWNSNTKINSALFLILGEGYFDYDGSWGSYSYFRLTPENGFTVAGNPDDAYMSNVLVRAQVENKQWGWIPRVNIKQENAEINLGAEIRFHSSLHWGAVQFANGGPTELTPEFKYYQYEGEKNMYSAFGNYNWQINSQTRMFWEAQVVYNRYHLFNEKFVGNDFYVSNTFLNPKFGVNYTYDDKTTIYGSLAIVSREPRLKNYYDAAEASAGETPQFEMYIDGNYDYKSPKVKPETMTSLEIGGLYKTELLELTANLYMMSFNNEIVKNGQLDRFGQPITGNVARTNHTGLELTALYKYDRNITLMGNTTISKNTIVEGSTFIKYRDPMSNQKLVQEVDLSGNKLGGFPGILLNLMGQYEKDAIFARITGRISGKFFSDNYDYNLSDLQTKYNYFLDYDDNVNEAYVTFDVFGSYTFSNVQGVKSIRWYIQIQNLLNTLYSQNAIGKEFFPGAERNIMTGLQVTLD